MFVHEFLNRTARRNLNLQIDCKVQQRIKSYVQNLEERRHQLACQLHWEEQQLQLELHELQQARADAAENKRIETIQLSIIQKEKTEKELIEQTRFQREMYVKSIALLTDEDNSYFFFSLLVKTLRTIVTGKRRRFFWIPNRLKSIKSRSAERDDAVKPTWTSSGNLAEHFMIILKLPSIQV